VLGDDLADVLQVEIRRANPICRLFHTIT
jgi:hypothetical protein